MTTEGEVTTGEAELLADIDAAAGRYTINLGSMGIVTDVRASLLTRCRASIAANASLRAKLDEIPKALLAMVEPLNPPPVGSYWRGHHQGIIDAANTARDIIARQSAQAASQPSNPE